MRPTEKDSFTLRPADLADCAELAELQLSARAHAPMPAGVHGVVQLQRWLEGRWGGDEIWVAQRGRGLLGYARFTAEWLDDLYVLPSAWGQGVGSALLELVKAQRPHGFCLWVFESNTPARRFYAHHGLVELERSDGTANEERSPDVRVAWPGTRPDEFLTALLAEVDTQLEELRARRTALVAALTATSAGPPQR